jgi:hypothetical protein
VHNVDRTFRVAYEPADAVVELSPTRRTRFVGFATSHGKPEVYQSPWRSLATLGRGWHFCQPRGFSSLRSPAPRSGATFAERIGWGFAPACLITPRAVESVCTTRARARLRPDKASVPAVQAPCAALCPRPSAVGAAAAAGLHGGRADALKPRPRPPQQVCSGKAPLHTPLAPRSARLRPRRKSLILGQPRGFATRR